jgi:hypothetical protein
MTDAADIVAKSFHALNHDSGLSAEARGQIMLHLSSLAGKVTLAKSDRVGDHLGKVRAALDMLDRARAEHHGAEADDLVEAIREAVKRGETEPSDLFALESRLRDVQEKLKDTTHGNEK